MAHVDVVTGMIIGRSKLGLSLPPVLMTRRPHFVTRGNMWEFPGGKVERTEDHATALAREMLEEIGVVVRVDPDLIARVVFELERDYTISLYRCHIEAGIPEPILSAELQWLDFDYAIEAMPLVPSCYWFYRRAHLVIEQAAQGL